MKHNFIIIIFLAFSSIFASFANAKMAENEYFDLVMTAVSAPIGIKNATQATNAFVINSLMARRRLCAEPPAEALPALYSLWQNLSYTNVQAKVYDANGKEFARVSFYDSLSLQLMYQNGLYLGYDTQGHIAMLFISGKIDDLIASPDVFHYYWWYEGRKQIDIVWAQWLSCWSTEMKREKPRKVVLKELISEITGLGFYVFPFIYSEMIKGNNSMQLVVDKFSDNLRGSWRIDNFCEWWNENKSKYNFPEPAGFLSIKSRIQQDATLYNCMSRWYENSQKFYFDEDNFKKNYWYFKLPNGEVSANDIKTLKNPFFITEEL